MEDDTSPILTEDIPKTISKKECRCKEGYSSLDRLGITPYEMIATSGMEMQRKIFDQCPNCGQIYYRIEGEFGNYAKRIPYRGSLSAEEIKANAHKKRFLKKLRQDEEKAGLVNLIFNLLSQKIRNLKKI